MKRAVILLLLALSLAGAAAIAATRSDPLRVIAQTDAGKVLYRMISCSTGQTTSDRVCEQRRLARRIYARWIEAAVKLHGVTLTPQEEACVAQETAAAEADNQIAAVRFHLLAEAALRICRGEDRNVVAAALESQHITEQDLAWELEHLTTVAAAERAAAKDYLAETRQATRDDRARPFVLAHLHAIVTQRAAARHISFDAAEEELWSDVACATHTRIVDPAFTLPDRKGILVNQ